MNTPTQSIAVSSQIHSYSELLQTIHDDLRIQHPEWVEPNGDSPICDSYESRLIEQLEALTQKGADDLHSRIVLPPLGSAHNEQENT